MTGSSEHPQVSGTITVTEGSIHYLGFEFDINRGFMEFQASYDEPYLEVEAEKEMGVYQITLLLHGRTNNLTLDLSGTSRETGPLDKRDVISLLTFGVTAREREQAQFLENQLAPSLVAERLSAAISPLVLRSTPLDVFRIEANPEAGGEISRFHLGKKLSDRLTVEFLSDVNAENAVQTLRAEYWLTDFLLFKGSRSSDENFDLNVGFRFTTR